MLGKGGDPITRQSFALRGHEVKGNEMTVDDGIKMIFQSLNPVGDGRIDIRQFVSSFREGDWSGVDPTYIIGLIRQMDKNSDHFISFSEFDTFLRELSDSVFFALDADNSGFLENVELVPVSKRFRLHWNEEKHQFFMRTLDRDRDGRIDINEFLNFVVVECLKGSDRGTHRGLVELFRIANQSGVVLDGVARPAPNDELLKLLSKYETVDVKKSSASTETTTRARGTSISNIAPVSPEVTLLRDQVRTLQQEIIRLEKAASDSSAASVKTSSLVTALTSQLHAAQRREGDIGEEMSRLRQRDKQAATLEVELANLKRQIRTTSKAPRSTSSSSHSSGGDKNNVEQLNRRINDLSASLAVEKDRNAALVDKVASLTSQLKNGFYEEGEDDVDREGYVGRNRGDSMDALSVITALEMEKEGLEYEVSTLQVALSQERATAAGLSGELGRLDEENCEVKLRCVELEDAIAALNNEKEALYGELVETKSALRTALSSQMNAVVTAAASEIECAELRQKIVAFSRSRSGTEAMLNGPDNASSAAPTGMSSPGMRSGIYSSPSSAPSSSFGGGSSGVGRSVPLPGTYDNPLPVAYGNPPTSIPPPGTYGNPPPGNPTPGVFGTTTRGFSSPAHYPEQGIIMGSGSSTDSLLSSLQADVARLKLDLMRARTALSQSEVATQEERMLRIKWQDMYWNTNEGRKEAFEQRQRNGM